jgi:hypothetical protein
MTSIRTATPPNLIGQPDNKLFRKNDFDSIIFQKGYDLIIEQAVACPCRGKSGEAKPTCQNCLGTGWVFLNPVKTKGVLSSINYNTKYKEWSPELVGTASLTVREEERLSFMDKVTFEDRTSVLSEVRPVIQSETKKFIFCSYKVRRVKFLFVFSTDNSKLINIPADKFNIVQGNNFVVEISNSFVFPVNFNGVISIDYEHEVSYNVIDIPHDFRSTFTKNNKGQQVEDLLPMQAIIRRSHFVLGEPTNYSGNNLINNDL